MSTILDIPDECDSYLWAILSDESGIDQAEFAYVDEASPDGCFRAWPFQWPWFRDDSSLQIDKGARCQPSGTRILTSTGWKSIETLQVGELVLTHMNRWKPILEVYDNGIKDVVSIKAQGHPDKICATADHPFLARQVDISSRYRDGEKVRVLQDPEWISPQDWVKRTDKIGTTCLASPASQTQALDESWRYVEPAYKSGKQNLVKDTLDVDWLWLYGLYIAEGCTHINKQFAQIKFCIHEDEVEFVSKMLDKVGLNHHVAATKDRGAVIGVNSRPLVQWLRAYTGHSASTKSIAPWVFGLEEKYRRAVFEGMVYGDGWARDSGRIEYTTVSRDLCLGLRILAQSLGYNFSVYEHPAHTSMIGDREVIGGVTYACSMEIVDNTRSRVIMDKGIAWTAYKTVTQAGQAHTWDIEVEDDHSFVAEGYVVHNSAGKSLSIKLRSFAFPFVHPGQEMLVTAPEGNHLDAVTNNIEELLYGTRLVREMLVKGRTGIKHRPFLASFQNGAKIIGRIPQRDGRGIKGQHPIWLELDEAQDYPHAGWVELFETVKRGNDDQRWRSHGVTRGVQDDFYKFTQPESGWKVHWLPAMYRPTFTDEERQEKIKQYGHKDNPDYRRNILGMHGDATSPIFVLSRLMNCTDKDESSHYNTNEYVSLSIDEAAIREAGSVIPLLDLPGSHDKYKNFWIGMDVGYAASPSAICIFAEHKPSQKAETQFKLLAKIMLKYAAHEHQVETILYLIEKYKPLAFAMDRTGLGLPLFQDIQNKARQHEELRRVVNRIKGYNFSEKIVVEFDDSVEFDEADPEGYKKAELKRGVLEFSTDVLRGLVDDKKLVLPWDTELIGEFQGQTWTYSKATLDMYGRKKVFCVDEETEILTKSGWKTRQELEIGDYTWGYLEPGKAGWVLVTNIHSYDGIHDMIKMSSTTHSSLTTLGHKWPIERLRTNHKHDKFWWHYKGLYTTEEVPDITRYRIPTAGVGTNLPEESIFSNDFVALIAWYMCEGNLSAKGQVSIAQSWKKNPQHCKAIEDSLNSLGASWGKSENKHGLTTFRIHNGSLKNNILAVCPEFNKVPSLDFLHSLTEDQLWIFVDICLRGDGWISVSNDQISTQRGTDAKVHNSMSIGFSQKNKQVTEYFALAATMIGFATSYRSYDVGNGYDYKMHTCTLRQTQGISTTALKRESVIHDGIVWCPETSSGTWLARRDGKVYFTGNSAGSFHALDACRMAALAYQQNAVEQFIRNQEESWTPPPTFFH